MGSGYRCFSTRLSTTSRLVLTGVSRRHAMPWIRSLMISPITSLLRHEAAYHSVRKHGTVSFQLSTIQYPNDSSKILEKIRLFTLNLNSFHRVDQIFDFRTNHSPSFISIVRFVLLVPSDFFLLFYFYPG